MSYRYQLRPMTDEEIKEVIKKDNYLTGVVEVSLSEIIDNDIEGFNDLLESKLVGDKILSDISYEIVGFVKDSVYLGASNVLHIQVTAEVVGIDEA